MRIRSLLIFLVTLTTVIGIAGCSRQEQRRAATPAPAQSKPAQTSGTGPRASPGARVPAHYETPPGSLPPTLPADKYTGQTRAAYEAAREIPQTLAQLPCYCHCDEGFGHKSLHSCFVGEDRHAAQCAVCVEEALAAYRMHKEEKLKPEQIRERIVAEYSKAE